LLMLKRVAFDFAGRRSACNLRDTLVLAGTPRSGTTWLLELFRTLPGYKALNEPLMYEEARQENGFSWRTHAAPDEHHPEKRNHLKEMLTGRLGVSPAWYFEANARPLQLLEHATQQKMVVKFCRAGRMLQWLHQQFDVRGTVLIIRHPCAVVASMLRHGGFEKESSVREPLVQHVLDSQDIPDVLRERFFSTLQSIDSQVEALAVMWCLDHYVPFHLHRKVGYPWVLTAYERLVAAGIGELERITDALGVEITEAMHAQLDVASSSIRDRPHREAQDQLSKWKDRLTPNQAEDILRIVDAFELDFYTDRLEPDYERLMHFQCDNARANISTYAT